MLMRTAEIIIFFQPVPLPPLLAMTQVRLEKVNHSASEGVPKGLYLACLTSFFSLLASSLIRLLASSMVHRLPTACLFLYGTYTDTDSLLSSWVAESDNGPPQAVDTLRVQASPLLSSPPNQHSLIPDYGVISSKESIGDVSYVSMEVGDTLEPPPSLHQRVAEIMCRHLSRMSIKGRVSKSKALSSMYVSQSMLPSRH